jgi:hypothetical protein
MELEVSVPCSQKFTIGHHTELGEYSPHISTYFSSNHLEGLASPGVTSTKHLYFLTHDTCQTHHILSASVTVTTSLNI